MSNINYIQVVEPDYKIHIGIKDGKICGWNWGEIIDHEKVSSEEAQKRFINYLQTVIKQHLESHGINEHYQRTETELTMLTSEKVLKKDWDTPEENKAWGNL